MGEVTYFPLERRFDDLGNRLGDYRGPGEVVILPCARVERHEDIDLKVNNPTRRRRNYEPRS